ncbi:hypothetical protein PU629_04620 [Pullulanibacillus sp. KACC 23026]|uniref:hypothetical protein n=1 Tax=Pullulanibacillus sp. KACC 23026 TaxID=3028315 RepID=UPI0023AFA6C8|nr:hypothetical protein [Pullulanibacillus sp. KACC 23026]WEG13654.1 hypothetical protein PU629_04620 [Pullulanibacillus sp. KACC 23026]
MIEPRQKLSKRKLKLRWKLLIEFGISGVLLSLAPFFWVIALYIFFSTPFNFLTLMLCLFILILGFAVFPKRKRYPKDVLNKDDYSALYTCINNILLDINYKPVDAIVVNSNFIVTIEFYGIRRRKVLYIGFPLWSILTNDEQSAIIIHEMAYSSEKYTFRGWILALTQETLHEWHKALKPTRIWIKKTRFGLALIPINLIMLGLSQIVLSIAKYYNTPNLKCSQDAKYLSVFTTMKYFGEKLTDSILWKKTLQDSFQLTIQQVILNKLNENVFEVFRDKVNHSKKDIDKSVNKERRMCVTKMDTDSIIRHANKFELQNVNRKLAELEPLIQKQVINSYKESLYTH